jgi:hypothetical protein
MGILAELAVAFVWSQTAMETLAVKPQSKYYSRAVDPQMRPLRWSGRPHSREARLYRSLRLELIRHVGGKPSLAQRALIDRLAWLQVHLALLDERMMRTGELSDHASRQYLAWANTLTRGLGRLGFEAAPAQRRQTSLADHIAAKNSQTA